MAILKLANAGDTATLDITGCEVVEGQYGEQVQFDAGEDRLYLPKSSADRQMERLGLGYEDVVGQKLTFSRTASTKPGSKPYWNIGLGTAAKAPTNGKPPVAKASAPKSPPSFANKPEEELPEFLRDAESQDAADLKAKLAPNGIPESIILRREAYATAQLQTVKIALEVLVPEYEKKEIGLTDDVVHKHAFELFKMWADKGLIG